MIAAPRTDAEFRRFVWRWMGCSLALHLLAAYFSMGYQSADEQFQILEFLGYWLGKTPVAELAVEYRERIRPWLQPGIYWVITKALDRVGVENPFQLVFAFRVFSALVGWLSLVGLAFLSGHWFRGPRARKLAVLGLALLFYFPVLHARPSSENLAGSVFLLGLEVILLLAYARDRKVTWLQALASGLLFGMSFEFRFQAGILIAGFFAWLLVVRKERLATLVWIALGVALMIGLGRAADRIAYGEWVLSPVRYFEYNLVRGEVARFGRSPWWDIFRMAFTETWPPLGLVLSACFVVSWIRHPRHPLTWCMVPFFLVHIGISHKELRFFYPIAASGGVLLALCFYSEKTGELILLPKALWAWFLRGAWTLLVFENCVAVLCLSVVPFARNIQFQEGIYDLMERERMGTLEILTRDRDPFEYLGSYLHFYRHAGITVTRVATVEDVSRRLSFASRPLYLFETSAELPPGNELLARSCQPVIRTLPQWIRILNFNDWLKRVNVWTLYRCAR